VLESHNPARIAIYSRDELKQYEMKQTYGDDPLLRFFIGGIRDRDSLEMAMHGVDYVVHAAALKQVDTAEYNPMEYVKANILGSKNVMGSRGSVVPFFRALAERGEPLTTTDLRMTRFWITLPQAIEFVIESFEAMDGGELYVPRIPSMHVTDLAKAIAQDTELVEGGIRPGEKLHEDMISPEDFRLTIRQSDRYVVGPTLAEWTYRVPSGDPVPDGFAYASDSNDLWITVDYIRNMLVDLGL
jgi:UDP-N-acetylglucosamine 4,6-dehydratase